MSGRGHWEQVYDSKAAQAVSWYEPHARHSVAFIRSTGVPRTARIIDVGSGASTLIDDLLEIGFENVTALDLAPGAMAATRSRLGARAARVSWIVGDVTQMSLPAASFDLWHDRAVFHFLTEASQRAAYRAALNNALCADGHLVVATFAEDGPDRCSGLPVRRYSPEALQAELGPGFEPVRHERVVHVTPSGVEQRFVYCHLRRADG